MNTRQYRIGVDLWPPGLGDTILFKKTGARLVVSLDDYLHDQSVIVTDAPQCPRCRGILSYVQADTSWVCHGCNSVPDRQTMRAIATETGSRSAGCCVIAPADRGL